MALARTAMDRLKKIWKNRNITKATKIRLVQTLVFRIFLYAAETWTLRLVEKKKIDVLKMFCVMDRISRESDSIERLIVQGKEEGTRGRGRSPMRWTDHIKSAVGGPLHECTRLSASREKWWMLVGRMTSALKDAS
ncbi:jg6249 [Pararge aegeria aegeria]|uniref:Jg6249 protein n=1 Tax=Pararge aegeria aegeria TaxID=348720 RepID=A0A8S4SAI2_9NEOP|nr:jg6249 [Pararge aegeria aegeria]